MNRKTFAALVALGFLYISSPLLLPVAMGGVLAALFTPWIEWLESRKVSRSIGAVVLTIGITIILILPTALLIFFTAKFGFSQLQSLKGSSKSEAPLVDQFLDSPKVHDIFEKLGDWLPVSTQDLLNGVRDFLGGFWSKLADVLGGVLAHLPGIAMTILIVVVSVYFFLADGKKLVALLQKNTIFSPPQTNKIMKVVAETCRSVILASLVSGLAQALMEVLGCLLTGTPNGVLIGLFIFVGSFIPVVGSAPISLFIALQQYVEGRSIAGIVLLVTAFLTMGVDNAIRPMFLKGSANLHPLIAFVAAFGALQTIGFSGVFLGPIIAALFVSTLKILLQPEEPPIYDKKVD